MSPSSLRPRKQPGYSKRSLSHASSSPRPAPPRPHRDKQRGRAGKESSLIGRISDHGDTTGFGRFLARRPALALAPRCSRGSPDKRGRDDEGDTSSTDWDKAWSTFKKKGKKTLFSEFTPNKYVTWNPRRSEYPLSEEVDPIKRAERSNLMLWTSPRFTLVGAIIIVSALLIYALVVPPK